MTYRSKKDLDHPSNIVYRSLKSDGTLTRQQKEVYDAVVSYPCRTSKELADLMQVDRAMPARRLPELERKGVIQNAGARQCSIAERVSYVWEPVND